MSFFSSLLPSKPPMHPPHSLSRAWTHFSLTVVTRKYVSVCLGVCTFSNVYTHIYILYMCAYKHIHAYIYVLIHLCTVTLLLACIFSILTIYY